MPQTLLTDLGETRISQAAGDESAVRIKSIALGDANGVSYDPGFAQTGLRHEVARRDIDAQAIFEANTWKVKCTFPADATPTSMIREIGFFDEAGTLIAIWAGTDVQPRQIGVVDYVLSHVLNFGRVADGLVVIDAQLDIEEALKGDLEGSHAPGQNFHFALTRNIGEHMNTSLEEFERLAQVRRSYGQSGLLMGRHYIFGGDAAYHRPGVVNFAAMGVHNHPNYTLMCGLPELSAVINGYEVNTRHVDYRVMHPVSGAYLAVEDAVPPAAPPSVLAQPTPEAQTAEMREYIRAFGNHDTAHRDYRPYFDTYVSVLECWLEDLSGDELVDTFPSFRHQLSVNGHKAMNRHYQALLATGIKSRFENDDFKPTVVRVMRPDGAPQFAVLRYRVTAVRLGTYADWPAHLMTSQVDDPVTRVRMGMSDAAIEATRLGRFRVNHALDDDDELRRTDPGLLDQIMSAVPGLDGAGAVIHEQFTDHDDRSNEFTQTLRVLRTGTPLNGAFYNRFYSYEHAGAAGRRDYRFGFNDPMLFRAASTRPEVTELPGMGGGHRISWAIPLELIVATPLGSWNPYNVPTRSINDPTPSGNGTTEATAREVAHPKGSWYRTPDELFDGADVASDPSDTNELRWMACGDGNARLMRGSGMFVHLPPVSGAPAGRLRYPIAPVHHEGSLEHGYVRAMEQEVRDFMAVTTNEIQKLKHTARFGGNNNG